MSVASGDDSYALTVRALQASLSSYISKAEREQCNRYIDELKQREECMNLMSRILSDDETVCSQYVKLMALSVLNDWIKHWWNRLPEQGKLAVKQLSTDMLTSDLAVHANASIRTKIAVILSNVVERVFPQYWPNFVREMIELWLASPFARQDVILKVLETVIIDSVDNDFNSALPTLRRQEIVAGIVEAQNPLFETSYNYLGYCFQEYTRLSAGADRAQTKVVGDALVSLLAMLSALTALAKIEDLCAPPHNFALVLVEMCNTPHIQMKAMELLSQLAYQTMPVELFAVLLQALAGMNVQTWPEEIEESLHFQRMYAAVLHTLLSQHVQYVLDSSSAFYVHLPGASSVLVAYINRMLQVVEQSPSIRLPADVIKDWVKIYREKNVHLCPTFRDVAMTVLNLFMQKCRKPLWTEFPPHTSHAANASGTRVSIRPKGYDDAFTVEFEDTEEWATEFYGTFKSQFRLLAQTISEKFCLLSAQTLSQYMGALVQAECASGALAVNTIEYKTQLLEFDMLHYVYGPMLQTLVASDTAKKPSSDSGKEEPPLISEEDKKAVFGITVAALGSLLQWKPHTPTMQQEQHKILQYHYPILKLSPDHLGAAFSLLFSALSTAITASSEASSNGTAAAGAAGTASAATVAVDHCTKISGSIASLTQHCAQEIVKTGFFQEFFQQVGTLLTQVPYVTVQNNMRQSLMALSDHIADPALRLQTLRLAVEDILQKWTTEYAALFSSSETLLEALLAQVTSSHNSTTSAATAVDNRWENMKRSIDSFLLATKRITNPSIPLEAWTNSASVSFDEYAKLFPFAPAWMQCLPVAFQGIGALHSIWTLQSRQTFEGLLTATLPAEQTQLLSAICLPDVGEIGKFAGMKLTVPTDSAILTPKFVFELKELRIFLYQLLAQAAAHKALYYVAGVDAFLADLVAHLPLMEHTHLVALMKNFVEQYMLNALPMFYPQVAKFLEAFFTTTLQRLSTAWDRSVLSPLPTFTAEQQFAWRVYRMCNISEGFDGLSAGFSTITTADGEAFDGFSREEIENARDHLIGEATRSFADVLAALFGLRGFLFTPHASAATAAAAEYMQLTPTARSGAGGGGGGGGAPGKGAGHGEAAPSAVRKSNTSIIITGKGKDKTVRKRVSFDNSDMETSIFDPPSTAKEPLTDEQQLELGKHARRQAIFALLTAKHAGLTQAFVSAVITLLCLPDANGCKFALQMAQKLLDLSLLDARFIVPVAKDAFSAVLSVLLGQEKWSIGMEWELIEFVLDVYLMLVVGEGRHPVNVGAGSGYTAAPGQATQAGMPSGAALVALHQHSARSEWPAQLLLSLNGVTREKLAEFDVNLQKHLSKKKRRGLMKDLISDAIAASATNQQQPSAGANGSVFSTAVPSVLDVRHRLMKSNHSRKQGAAAADVDLSRLFEG